LNRITLFCVVGQKDQ